MTFRAVRDAEQELRPGVRGIPAPSAESPEVEPAALDVVLTPGMAYDVFGLRIGTGGGYYDRVFGTSERRPLVVGVGFSFQLVWEEALPFDPWDSTVDWVVTEREVVKCFPRTYVLGDGNEHNTDS